MGGNMRIKDLPQVISMKGITIRTSQGIQGEVIHQEVLLKLQGGKLVPVIIDSPNECLEWEVITMNTNEKQEST